MIRPQGRTVAAGAPVLGGGPRTETRRRESVVREALAALGAGESERLLACLTPDATLDDPMVGREIRGPAALATWFDVRRGGLQRVAFEPLRLLFEGDSGAVEWSARARDTAGRESAHAGSAMLEFEGDRISRISLYYDGRPLGAPALLSSAGPAD